MKEGIKSLFPGVKLSEVWYIFWDLQIWSCYTEGETSVIAVGYKNLLKQKKK